MKKRRIWDIVLLAILAILIFSPVKSYIKRYLNPNNNIEVSNKEALNQESLDLQLKGLNTKNITLKDTQGKLTFLHFWGNWCPDCRLEMPYVQSFYEEYKDKMNFVLIDIERKEGLTEKVKKYLSENNFTAPNYEPLTLLSKQLKINSYPTTFIIDKQGFIISKHEGATDWSKPEVRQQINDLLSK